MFPIKQSLRLLGFRKPTFSFSRQPLGGFENGGDEFPTQSFVYMKRHEAIIVEIAVEQRQLLMTMNRVVGVVKV